MTALYRPTVFIVDDVVQNIQIAATALRDEGFVVSLQPVVRRHWSESRLFSQT